MLKEGGRRVGKYLRIPFNSNVNTLIMYKKSNRKMVFNKLGKFWLSKIIGMPQYKRSFVDADSYYISQKYYRKCWSKFSRNANFIYNYDKELRYRNGFHVD